jgi:pimeloyl-ACP methyl ester carboxylesterase
VTRIAWEAAGEGPPVLLIHGLGYARWGWGPVVEPLARRFRVLTFDNRGIGESEVPQGPYTARELADDALAVLGEAGIERAHVVGTSLGGMVAQELALAHPERVSRLVLACTTPGGAGAFPLPERTVALLQEATTLAPEVALRRFVENALSSRARNGLVDEIYRLRLEHPPDPAGWQAQAAAGMTFDAFDRVGEIAAPTLILHGTDDGVVDVRNAELLAERIPDSRVELFEGCGHLFFWEEPDHFVRAVEEFLC